MTPKEQYHANLVTLVAALVSGCYFNVEDYDPEKEVVKTAEDILTEVTARVDEVYGE